MKKALVLFAREPVFGKVKTRLAGDLTANHALNLYTAFLKDVINLSKSTLCEGKFIYYAGQPGAIPFLKAYENKFILKRQTGKDLGERMLKCFTNCQKSGFDKTIIIGVDCVTIKPEDIKNFKELDEHDCVLGPSNDGGYYLIGLKEPLVQAFKRIKWGSGDVFEKTVKILEKSKKKVFTLPKKVDIDRIDDLYLLNRSIERYHSAIYTKIELKKVFKDLTEKNKKRTGGK